MYWWLYPSRITLFIFLPIFLACAWTDTTSYIELYKQSANFISGEPFWLGLTGLFAFGLGSWLAEPQSAPAVRSHIDRNALNNLLVLLYAITLAAYAIFLFPIISHPSLLTALAQGSKSAMFDLRETLDRIPGITSFMALQSLCILLHAGYKRLTGFAAPAPYRILMCVLIACCLLRAWLWSERLAMLELLIPALLIWLAHPAAPKKQCLVFSPFIGALGVFFLFCIGEYFRSWQFHQDGPNSFLGFCWIRFEGYFATALNNGAMYFHIQGPAYMPFTTMQWFYKFPLWSLLHVNFDDMHIAYNNATLGILLHQYGNEEYNNPGGLFMPFCDYGEILGACCWFILGLISGTLLKGFVNSTSLGLVLFPVWYVGVLDMLRVFYWGDSRFFPVLCAGAIIAWYLKKNTRAYNP